MLAATHVTELQCFYSSNAIKGGERSSPRPDFPRKNGLAVDGGMEVRRKQCNDAIDVRRTTGGVQGLVVDWWWRHI